MSPDTQERFAVQQFIDAIKDQDDRLRLRRDKPRTMDEALSLACDLEAFRLLDGDWREALRRESGLFKAQMEMLRFDLQPQQQHQETQQDALQQLVQQIKQLSQSMSLDTSEN